MKNLKLFALFTAIIASWALMVWGLVGFVGHYSTPEFGPVQPASVVEGRYERCKAKAPEGWDCIMVPMLVSEEFVKENSRE